MIHAFKVQKATRPAFVKLIVFTVFSVLLAAYLFVIVGDVHPGKRTSYGAIFTNVSGLKSGDDVRVASVAVGKISSTKLRDDGTVLVKFDIPKKIGLSTSTTATVRYKNLIGDRYLALERPDNSADIRLSPGGTIAANRTAAALSLDTLLNGFKPLFVGLAPREINMLSEQLVQVLQGQASAVTTLISTIDSFTTTVGAREKLVSDVLTNLDVALNSVTSGDQLGTVVDQLSILAKGLDAQAPGLTQAVTSIDGLSNAATGLLQEARTDITPSLRSLDSVASTLNDSHDYLQTLLNEFPTHFRTIQRTGSFGNFFNFFLCGVRLRLSPENQKTGVLYSPWINSDLARCQP